LDKFVGGSEEKVRELFADAEKEQAEMGDGNAISLIVYQLVYLTILYQLPCFILSYSTRWMP
jgi:hypothetical protein